MKGRLHGRKGALGVSLNAGCVDHLLACILMWGDIYRLAEIFMNGRAFLMVGIIFRFMIYRVIFVADTVLVSIKCVMPAIRFESRVTDVFSFRGQWLCTDRQRRIWDSLVLGSKFLVLRCVVYRLDEFLWTFSPILLVRPSLLLASSYHSSVSVIVTLIKS